MQYPLTLGINPTGWHLYSLRKADPAFRKFQEKVFLRDSYECQFCGFQEKGYFDVVNLDGNYRNNKISNMATACCFCVQCNFIDNVGRCDYGGGTLIYAPNITQNQLNSLCHVLFCAMTNDTGYKNSAKNIFRHFKLGSQSIDKKFGEGTCDPITFSQLLIESDINFAKDGKTVLKDIRLLPSQQGFMEQIQFWAKAALDALEEECVIKDR